MSVSSCGSLRSTPPSSSARPKNLTSHTHKHQATSQDGSVLAELCSRLPPSLPHLRSVLALILTTSHAISAACARARSSLQPSCSSRAPRPGMVALPTSMALPPSVTGVTQAPMTPWPPPRAASAATVKQDGQASVSQLVSRTASFLMSTTTPQDRHTTSPRLPALLSPRPAASSSPE